jgi:hypothetical protein
MLRPDMLLSEAPNLVYVLVLPTLIMVLSGVVGLVVYIAVGWMAKGRGSPG